MRKKSTRELTEYVKDITPSMKVSEDDGKRIYNTNETYRSIANLMEHPEFRKVYDKHFGSMDEVRVILMFMKTYETVGKKLPGLTGYQKLSVMDKVINDTETRHRVCDEFMDWVNLTTSIEKSNFLVKGPEQ
jgi:hypothetical protein